MVRTSLLEKLEILKNVIGAEPFLLAVFGCFILLGIILYGFSHIDKNKYIKGFLSIYLCICLSLIIGYNVNLYKVFDYLVNNVFYTMIFPNIAIYFAMIIISNILLIHGLFNEKLNKKEKIVNVLFYSVLSFFLFIVLKLITEGNINVYDIEEVYTNKELCTIIQLNMILFLIWIFTIIINKIFRKNINSLKDNKDNLETFLVENSKEEINDVVNVNSLNNDNITPLEEENNKGEDNINEEYKTFPFSKEEYIMLSRILKEELEKEKEEEIR